MLQAGGRLRNEKQHGKSRSESTEEGALRQDVLLEKLSGLWLEPTEAFAARIKAHRGGQGGGGGGVCGRQTLEPADHIGRGMQPSIRIENDPVSGWNVPSFRT